MELKSLTILQVSCVFTLLSSLLPSIDCIQVDWNTNQGPIVPPTSTPQPIPQRPYRDPAPVYENQSDDIPNPNEYKYVMPPPSRPRQNDLYDNDWKYNKWQAYKQQKLMQYEYQQQQQLQNRAFGQVIGGNAVEANQNVVPSLAVVYIPNYGFRYFAVVNNNNNQKQQNLKTNDLYNGKYDKHDKYDKWNGKFNDKTKSYKAYETAKVKPLATTNYQNVPKQQQNASKLQQTSPQVFPKQAYEQPANNNNNNYNNNNNNNVASSKS